MISFNSILYTNMIYYIYIFIHVHLCVMPASFKFKRHNNTKTCFLNKKTYRVSLKNVNQDFLALIYVLEPRNLVQKTREKKYKTTYFFHIVSKKIIPNIWKRQMQIERYFLTGSEGLSLTFWLAQKPFTRLSNVVNGV